MKQLSRHLLWIIRNIEELVAGTALVTMVSITTINVLCRYFFRSPIHWAEELAVICLVWSTFIGSAACFKRRAHLGMDFIIARLPYKGRRLAQQLLCVIQLCFFAFITVLAVNFALSAEKTTPFFHLNYFYLYIAAALGFFSMAVHSISFLVMSIRKPGQFDGLFVNKQTAEE